MSKDYVITFYASMFLLPLGYENKTDYYYDENGTLHKRKKKDVMGDGKSPAPYRCELIDWIENKFTTYFMVDIIDIESVNRFMYVGEYNIYYGKTPMVDNDEPDHVTPHHDSRADCENDLLDSAVYDIRFNLNFNDV